MRMSQLFVQTLREAPGEARTPGYRFLLRAGLVRALAGSYAFLPLGVMARQRVEAAARRALHALGGQPVTLPAVQAGELAEAGVRAFGGRSVRFRDRGQREMALADGHEAAVLATAAGVIQSYKQLPVLLYESRLHYRDEDRPAGGVLGTREGLVVDIFSLHADATDLGERYARVRSALSGIVRLGEPNAYEAITAEDANRAATAHKLILPFAGGEEAIARCPACGYAAEQAAARVAKAAPISEPLLPMEDVATPDCKTIAELAGFLGIPQARTAKAVFLVAAIPGRGDRFVFAIVRGDTALNEAKLRAVLNATALGPATEGEIRDAGAEPGYGSPVGLSGAMVIVDELAARSPNLVAGANRPGYHTLNVNCGRDYQASIVADIAMVQDGSPCPVCGSHLTIEGGIALAEAAAVGSNASQALGATYLDREGQAQSICLGRYRLYVDRLLAATAERHHDEHGIVWPIGLAPCEVHLMTLGKASPELAAAADRLYAELTAAGLAVLYDDRDERAGVKFNDADLIGAPVRVAVGDRGLKAGTVEVKRRSQSEVQAVPVTELVAFVHQVLGA